MQLGGNSLQAGAVCTRVRAALQLDHAVPITWLMQSQTIRALATRLTDAADMQTSATQQTAVPRLAATISKSDSTSSAAPLTFQQEQFYQLWNRDRSSTAYNSGFMVVLQGQLDPAALQAAMQLVFERQQSLRTRFLVDDSGVPMQRIAAVPSKEDCLQVEQPSSGFAGLDSMADGSFSLVEGTAFIATASPLSSCALLLIMHTSYGVCVVRIFYTELLTSHMQAQRCTSASWLSCCSRSTC